MKSVMRFDPRGKLNPKYVGSFLILEKIGEVAFKVALQLALLRVYNVSYVPFLWRYMPNPRQLSLQD